MYDTSHLNIKCRQLRGGGAKKKAEGAKGGPHGESNPGPLAPKASIIPLDHAASNWRLQKIF